MPIIHVLYAPFTLSVSEAYLSPFTGPKLPWREVHQEGETRFSKGKAQQKIGLGKLRNVTDIHFLYP